MAESSLADCAHDDWTDHQEFGYGSNRVFKVKTLSLNLPFGIGGISMQRTEAQARAAWALYVELATRISTQPLHGEGSVREALTSLHSLFNTTRAVLREHGPDAADGPWSVGPIAITMLNEGVRPFLTRWHSRFSRFEHQERVRTTRELGPYAEPLIDEYAWPDRSIFFTELERFRVDMNRFLNALELLAGISADE